MILVARSPPGLAELEDFEVEVMQCVGTMLLLGRGSSLGLSASNSLKA